MRIAKPGGLGRTVIKTMVPMLRDLVGEEPPYCPWRAFWEPIVVEAMRLRGRKASLDIGTQPAVLVQAMELIEATQNRIEIIDRKAEMARRKAESEIRNR